MLIRVKYQNDKFDYIKPWFLDRLIKANRIQAFYRKPGGVVVGMDRMRGSDNSNYQGPERRKKGAFNPVALVYLPKEEKLLNEKTYHIAITTTPLFMHLQMPFLKHRKG